MEYLRYQGLKDAIAQAYQIQIADMNILIEERG